LPRFPFPNACWQGQFLEFSYIVENRGGGDTPPLQGSWEDHIYLSADEFLDIKADRYLGTLTHSGGLNAGEAYERQSGLLRLPAELVGSYYVFVRTDAPSARTSVNGAVFEAGRENNNVRASAQPLLIELPPPADLVVESITTPPRATVNEPLTLSWTVRNQGEHQAQGSWSDAVYLSADGDWDLSDVLLGRVTRSGGLASGASYTAQLAGVVLPPALEGQYRIIVRSDIFNTVHEGTDESNNARTSADPLLVEVPQLALGVATATSLSSGQSRLYKVVVPAGETLRLRLDSNQDAAANEIFVRYNALPDGSSYDVASGAQLQADQQVLLPSTQAGVYYVLVRQFSGAAQPAVQIKAETLPFQVSDIEADQGGDSGWVTVTVRGARFHPEALLKLVRPGIEEIEPARYEVVDATTIIAAFNLKDRERGLYDVAVSNPDGATASLPYRFLLERALPNELVIALGGPRVIPVGQSGLYGISLQSLTNIDTPYVYVEFGVPEIGDNDRVHDLPYLSYSSNIGGAPDGVRTDVPWISLDSEINRDGRMLAPGYALDVAAGAYVGLSFSVTPYPALQAMLDRDLAGIRLAIEDARGYLPVPQREAMIVGLMVTAADRADAEGLRAQLDISIANLLEALEDASADEAAGILVQIEDLRRPIAPLQQPVLGGAERFFAPFRFNVFAASTALTREEFVARQSAEALKLRDAILADDSAGVALLNLAADADTWVSSYLAALEQAGLLRAAADAPSLRSAPKVIGALAVLASGVLVGPAGQQIESRGDLLAFFEQVHRWYGDTPGALAPISEYELRSHPDYGSLNIPIPDLPEFASYDLGLSQQTYFASFNVFVANGALSNSAIGSVAASSQLTALQLQELLTLAGQVTTQASISGPQGYGEQQFLPAGQALPYSIRFENPADANANPAEIRIVSQLDPSLSARSFRLGSMQLGDITINVPADRSSFQGDFDLRNSRGFILRVSAGIDVATATMTWLLQAIDPTTGELLQTPGIGLLPPNSANNQGLGTVSYSVSTAFDLDSNREVRASARVIFNTAAPLDTPELVQMLDAQAPVTTLELRRLGNGADYEVNWVALDEPDGSGLRHTTVYVAEDGGEWRIWLRQSSESSAVFQGEAGKRYEFVAVSTDNAGNQERPLTVASLPDDGTQLNLGSLPQPGSTTRDIAPALPPSESPSSNALFLQARQGIPAVSITRSSQFAQVLAPFKAELFASGIGASHAGVGALAILVEPDGSVIVSGGENRGALYRFSEFGGRAVNPFVVFDEPVYDMAYGLDGRLWASTGGGQLLELDPSSFAILGRYGESLTQALAVDPDSGDIYVSSGDGIEIFDPRTLALRHFSDVRVDDLAFAPDGTLWGSSWPLRGDLLSFDERGRAQRQLSLDDAVDSLAFGKAGTALAGLLFVSSHPPPGQPAGANLIMVDLATRQHLNVASQGPLAEALAIGRDGRLLVANGAQIDVLMPVSPPNVLGVSPAAGVVVPLPLRSIEVVFDQDMNTLGAARAESVLNPDNYVLLNASGSRIAISSVSYAANSRTVTLGFDTLLPDYYSLTVNARVQSGDGLALRADFVSDFVGVQDFSSLVRLDFLATRSDRADGTLSFDVRVTNITDYELQTPLLLILDPGRYFQGSAVGAGISDDGLWMLDIGAGLAGNVLGAGESTVVRTITLGNSEGQRADLGYGLYAVPYANRAPEIGSVAPLAATVGELWSYQLEASDPDGAQLSYVLLEAPAGMSIDSDGLLRWLPDAVDAALSPVVLRVYDARGSFAAQSFDIALQGGNRAPQLGGLPDAFELRTGTLFRLGLDASDPDGQSVSIHVDDLPPGAVFDMSTRVLSWLPGQDQAGYYDQLRIVVSDGITSTVRSLALLVRPANVAPLISGVPPRAVREGDPIVLRLSARDPGGDTLRFLSPNLPRGASLDPVSGVFEWTPGFDQAGSYEIALWASDGQLHAETLFRVEVSNVNGAPVFDRLEGWTVLEGQGISFRAFAFDPDNPGFLPDERPQTALLDEFTAGAASVVVTVEGLPPGASFDSTNWVFDWVPDFTQAGDYTVRFTATDDGDGTGVPQVVSIDVPLTVHNANRAPSITAFGNQSVARGETRDIALDISDPDGNPLEILAQNLPRFARILTLADGSRVLRIAPGMQDRGDYVVTLIASDDGDGAGERSRLSASYTFVISAESPAEAPVLAPIGDKVAVFGQPLRFVVTASDLDQDTLTWRAEGMPQGATLTPGSSYGTAVFDWTPQAVDAGEYTLTFRVTDDGNNGEGAIGADSRSMRIVVRASNSSPLLLPIGNQRVAEGESLSLQIAALDADGDALEFSATGLPSGARLDAASGLLTFTPDYFQAGSYGDILITASDGNASVSERIVIDVANSNRAPLLKGIAPLGGQETRLLQFRLEAADQDGDVVLYSLLGYTRDGVAQPGTRPAGVLFDERSGRFEWLPGHEQSGDYVFRFAARDLLGGSDTLDVAVRIADVNRAPVLALNNRQTALGVPLQFRIGGSDPDSGETLRFAAQGLPQGATLDALSGEFSWTPGPGQSGDYLVLVELSDGKTSTIAPLSLRVTMTPEAPLAAIALTPGFAVLPGQSLTVTLQAQAFSGVVSRSLFLDGEAVALDAQHRAVITAPAPGTYVLSALVSDRDGLQSRVERILRVRDPADTQAPQLAFDVALNGTRLQSAQQILARISDSNLESWQLEIARNGSAEWLLLAQGDSALEGALAELDPARFESGFYSLRLSARDVAGRNAVATVELELAAAIKQGQYLREESDFSFVLGGHELQFVRRYDSLASDAASSFGAGWSLALRDVRIETNVPASGGEAAGIFNPLRLDSRVFLTAPDGQRLSFRFAPQQVQGAGFSWWTPAWVADDDSGWQLSSVDIKLQRGSDRFYALADGVPYNPGGFADERSQYQLLGPDGTRYEIAVDKGVSAIVFADGVRLDVSDSGISGPGNQSLRWVRDANGALRQVTTPDGRSFLYGYDADGNLASLRDLGAARSVHYGYAEPATHQLTLVADGVAGEAIRYGDSVEVMPLAADLGAARGYLMQPRVASFSAGDEHFYSLVTRDSEVLLAADAAVLLGVIIEADAASGFAPALPELAGHVAIASRVEDGRSFALFRIDRASLDLLRVTGSGEGDYSLSLFVAGDANRDGIVDGRDADLLAQLRNSGGYSVAADFDLDGVLGDSDSQLLYATLGYSANQAPVVDAGARRTHVDLELGWDLASLISDPEGDPLFVGILGASNGSVRVGGDGRTLYYLPDPGFVGEGSVIVYADDGYGQSAAVELQISVSDARLLGIDFDWRAPKLRAGEQWLPQLLGDFEDEQDVPLPLGYISLSTLDPGVATLGDGGALFARADGTTVLRASRGDISAATAVSVGVPDTALGLFTYYFGIDAYPDSIALLPGESRQMVVQWGDGMYLSGAADGTVYVVGDSSIASVSADGRIVARSVGSTTITVINRSGEQVVPLAVVLPADDGALGAAGGVVVGSDGQMLAFGPGQLVDGSTVSITTLTESELATPIPDFLDFAAALRIEVQGSDIEGPVQIAVPVDAGYAPGETVYFFREISSGITGTMQTYWAAIDTGVVGEDGYARTTSPPWPGLSDNGNILMARANMPVRTISFDVSAWSTASELLLLGAATGLAGFVIFGSLAVATIVYPVMRDETLLRLYASYADQTLSVDIPVDVGQDSTRIRVNVPTPPESPLLTPVVLAAGFDAALGELTLEGRNFGAGAASARQVRVAFEQGGAPVYVAAEELLSSSATQLRLRMPPQVVLGLAGIYVETATASASGNLEWVRSQRISIDNPGGYGFVGEDLTLKILDLQSRNQGGVEQLVKEIDLGQFIVDTVATADLSRVFVAVSAMDGKPGGIHVIDGVSLNAIDMAPATPGIDPVALPYGSPRALALDPAGRYLYVASGSSITVIDIRPGATLHQVVQVIPVATQAGINDIAVNADGTRLWLTAPSAQPWYSNADIDGELIVINIDENDRPQAATQGNPRAWREVIGRFDGKRGPEGITATSDPDRMAFVSRYGSSGVARNEPGSGVILTAFPERLDGLHTVTVTNNAPGSFAARVNSVSLDLSTSFDQYYQLDVHNPHDVVVLPDLSYAFVSDWAVPILSGELLDPAYWNGYEASHGIGAKIAIIKDPFGPNARIVAATTPIPYGFATDLRLSSDASKLYATYQGAGDVLVFDVRNLIATVNANDAETLRERPVDQLGTAVNLPAIAIGPGLRGLALQPLDPLRLISPVGTRSLHGADATLGFEWLVDTRLLGRSDFTAQVFVSTLRPGEGLWPDDPQTPRAPGYDSDPSYNGSDNNPNRVWTSGLLTGATRAELPFSPDVLTAGQRYHWGVKIVSNGETYYKSASFVAEPINLGAPYNGVTLITHGFDLGASLDDGLFRQPGQFMALGGLIAAASGGGVVLSYNKNTGQWVNRETGASGLDALRRGEAVVLVADWSKESDISDSGFRRLRRMPCTPRWWRSIAPPAANSLPRRCT
jgi:YD repeat-containing protein